nr:cyclin-dependent kinase-like 4 [Parasteatoda tepidariorum]
MWRGAKTTSDDKRAKRVKEAIEILQREKKYTSLGYIGSGSFGQVFRMIEPLNKSELAVKIVPYEMVAKAESELWKNLSHPNLVSLIGMHKLENQKTFVFLMPVYPTTLLGAIQDLNPCKGAYNIVKSWLKDVLQGLDYLHSKGACHLDLKLDNVLISDENSALLCDFTFLRESKKPLHKHQIGMPLVYQPPEVVLSKGRENLDGTRIDMWAFGCLAMEMLSCFAITNAASMDERKQMYTTVLSLLEENGLLWPITKFFSADDLRETDVKLALRFMKEFLAFDASYRLPACEALMHDFFHEDDDSFHENIDAKHTPPTNSTEPTLRIEPSSVDEAAVLENTDAEKPQTLETNWKQVNTSIMSEIVVDKSTDEQIMARTGMMTLMSDTISVKSIKSENEGGLKPTDIDELEKEQSTTKTGDNAMEKKMDLMEKRMDLMEKRMDLISLKMIEMTDEMKYLRIKMESIERHIKPIDSKRINTDEVAIVHKGENS